MAAGGAQSPHASVRVGLIGFGAIGRVIGQAIVSGQTGESVLSAVLVRRDEAAREIAATWRLPAMTSRDRFLEEQPDLVVECAGHQAVRDHVVAFLEAGCTVVVSSVGAFTDDQLWHRARLAAVASGGRLIIPSAGVAGLDVLAAGMVGGLDSVTMTVIKSPAAWTGTPAAQMIDLEHLSQRTCIYDGPVRAGAATFPQNVNIAAAVALAGLGLNYTRLVIEVDPAATHHIVEVVARGAFGHFSCRLENLPTEEHAKTGKLVAMALIKTIRQHRAAVVTGW